MRRNAALIALSSAFVPLDALAQTPDAPPANGQAQELSTVVVEAQRPVGQAGNNEGYKTSRMNTATGMNLSAKDTPQSVTSVTAQRMADQGSNDTISALDNVVGLQTKTVDADRLRIYSRGSVVNTTIFNGMPITAPDSSDHRFDFGDTFVDSALLERIEVLRGANGLMQGAGTPSAAINLVQKRPTYDYQGSFELGTGSWDRKRGVMDLSGPLTDDRSVRGRFVYAGTEQDAEMNRYSREQHSLYGVVEADLDDQTTFTLRNTYQYRDSDSPMVGGLPIFYSDGSRTRYSRSASTSPEWASNTTRNYIGQAELEHYLNPDWSVDFSFMYSRATMDQPSLWSFGAPDPQTNEGLVPGSFYDIDSERIQRTFNVRVNGRFNWLGREHEMVMGATHWHQEFEFPYYSPSNFSRPYPPLGDFTRSGFDYGDERPDWDKSTVIRNQNGEQEQTSAYIATNWALTDDLHLLLGSRLDRWETDQNAFGTPIDKSVHEWTPYTGLTWALTPEVNLYTSYTRIFTPQNRLGRSREVIDPVTGSNYEAGIKSSLFEDRLDLSAAVFESIQDNYVDSTSAQLDDGLYTYEAYDNVKTRGFEFEANGAVTPQWNIYGGYSYARIESPDDERMNTDIPTSQVKLFTTYDLAGPLDGLTVGGGVKWQSKTFADITNPASGESERIQQDDFFTTDLMARYRVNQNLSLTANLYNAFDEKYYYLEPVSFSQYFYGAPRSFSVGLKYDL
ncbi:outer-membrane receptor for ferric coprogen and ferric-rhodotorulic acid [Kushneria avicenniae]|uniref:Outer-membrane receptor for ferric coprogen and ferric-rhodotorulic acid n=1 Tax=Kushneria avicenniae TaxID=402385 RepID=A0A1I1JSA7_9GAMM|nr:outer-membrane receptor for ferric coprogen and ferric-rhodotorulic acid [Kushneria avicenniae]